MNNWYLKFMTTQKNQFSDPACCKLAIKGEVSQDTLDILANFFQGNISCEKINKNTHLQGIVKDQVALSGLLAYLCDLHYTLLSVKTINKPYCEN